RRDRFDGEALAAARDAHQEQALRDRDAGVEGVLREESLALLEPGLQGLVAADVVQGETRRDELEHALLLGHLLFFREDRRERLVVERRALREDLRNDMADLGGRQASQGEGDLLRRRVVHALAAAPLLEVRVEDAEDLTLVGQLVLDD